MRRPRVFTDQPLAAGRTVDLETGPARHLVKVLRLRPGDEVVLFNGDGLDYPGRMVATGDRGAGRLEVGDPVAPGTESPLDITLVQAVGKGEKMDWLVQKAVELGVAAILPVLTERGQVRLEVNRAAKKHDHWRKVAVAACEQSGRARVPEVKPPRPLAEVLDHLPRDAAGYVLHPGDDATVGDIDTSTAAIVLVVGPEGGWTDTELKALTAAGLVRLGFGPRVLRTETAGPAVIAALQARLGDC